MSLPWNVSAVQLLQKEEPNETSHVRAREGSASRADRYLLAYTNYAEFERSCYELLNRAEFSNRHKNDAVFMMRLHERHGYDCTFRFKEFKNVLFVIVDSTVTTVLDTDDHRTSRQHGRVKKI